MKTDLFIRSYRQDFAWLDGCIKSAVQWCSGFDRLNLVVPAPDFSEAVQIYGPNKWVRVIGVEEHGLEGYLAQQESKLCADWFTDAELVVFVDSDCVFTQPVTPETYLQDDKPLLVVTPYTSLATAVPCPCFWQGVSEQVMGFPCYHETMRRQPLVFWTNTIIGTRLHIERRHHRSIHGVLKARPRRSFSEFNALGAYALHYQADHYVVLNTDSDPIPESGVTQYRK